MDHCCKIEHAHFFGGLGTIGLNRGVLISQLAMRLPGVTRQVERRRGARSITVA